MHFEANKSLANMKPSRGFIFYRKLGKCSKLKMVVISIAADVGVLIMAMLQEIFQL